MARYLISMRGRLPPSCRKGSAASVSLRRIGRCSYLRALRAA
jgi:hypothetical protein